LGRMLFELLDAVFGSGDIDFEMLQTVTASGQVLLESVQKSVAGPARLNHETAMAQAIPDKRRKRRKRCTRQRTRELRSQVTRQLSMRASPNLDDLGLDAQRQPETLANGNVGSPQRGCADHAVVGADKQLLPAPQCAMPPHKQQSKSGEGETPVGELPFVERGQTGAPPPELDEQSPPAPPVEDMSENGVGQQSQPGPLRDNMCVDNVDLLEHRRAITSGHHEQTHLVPPCENMCEDDVDQQSQPKHPNANTSGAQGNADDDDDDDFDQGLHKKATSIQKQRRPGPTQMLRSPLPLSQRKNAHLCPQNHAQHQQPAPPHENLGMTGGDGQSQMAPPCEDGSDDPQIGNWRPSADPQFCLGSAAPRMRDNVGEQPQGFGQNVSTQFGENSVDKTRAHGLTIKSAHVSRITPVVSDSQVRPRAGTQVRKLASPTSIYGGWDVKAHGVPDRQLEEARNVSDRQAEEVSPAGNYGEWDMNAVGLPDRPWQKGSTKCNYGGWDIKTRGVPDRTLEKVKNTALRFDDRVEDSGDFSPQAANHEGDGTAAERVEAEPHEPISFSRSSTAWNSINAEQAHPGLLRRPAPVSARPMQPQSQGSHSSSSGHSALRILRNVQQQERLGHVSLEAVCLRRLLTPSWSFSPSHACSRPSSEQPLPSSARLSGKIVTPSSLHPGGSVTSRLHRPFRRTHPQRLPMLADYY